MEKPSYLNELPAAFSDNSRVWIFQSNRPFIGEEIAQINEQLLQFYLQWQAHGIPVKGWAKLIYDRFVIVMADEAASTTVSGCSTDSMVRIIKSLERQYKVNFFDRMSLLFLVNEKAEMLPMHQVQYAFDKGFINWNTVMFNNLVDNKKDLETKWLIPIKDSWLKNSIQADSSFSNN